MAVFVVRSCLWLVAIVSLLTATQAVQVLSDIVLDVSQSFNAPDDNSLAFQRWAGHVLGGYRPTSVPCPAQRPSVRDGSTISPQEREWLSRRRTQTAPQIRRLLRRIDIPGFDSDGYLRRHRSLPTIGIAVSGGGYRAMLVGAGALNAWDGRAQGSTRRGGLGGLLQSTTYLSGLSGGGWLVGSLYANNFTSVEQLVDTWRLETNLVGYTKTMKPFVANLAACEFVALPHLFQDNIMAKQKNSQLFSLASPRIKQLLKEIIAAVQQKRRAGFKTSLADYWGRALSYQLVNAPQGGPGLTFSSIADDAAFSSGELPLPLLVADGASPGMSPLPVNTTVFEFSPWEMGSYDDSLNGFAPLKYLGSPFETGLVPPNERCVVGFDNTGFVMGTSSFLFNMIVDGIKNRQSTVIPAVLSQNPTFQAFRPAIISLLDFISSNVVSLQGAFWAPNPFKGWNRLFNPTARSDNLALVDGAEDGQNLPLQPHLLADRKVDVVFAVDVSSDTNLNWPTGASLISTYRRSVEVPSRKMSFPAVPDKNTFINLGYNSRPTFFGCDASKLAAAPSPLIVYLPNYPYLALSNISTITKLAFLPQERDELVANGWAVATQLDSARDPEWSVCVGCAILARSFGRTRTRVPDSCSRCFRRYCWDGQVDEREPGEYQPSIYSQSIGSAQ
ncbi:hypothetical protein L249_5243 [Ophiocordyceps polyrhachis-furcata BCC 54312]|uniref:Lysophospholipase n=1 Tax=Ophiocordyceps polyrhachis-furcata BCC 54312 TaxID=1330021 RepID=A0A367L8T3_9HYPO|nr:hypothetical protein L249_5243 [Ophiocordyceps polyrhachis-furcata BCC 54312]